MINGVGASQQQVQTQQPIQPASRAETRGSQTTELRERDRDRDDTTSVSRTRSEAITRSRESSEVASQRQTQQLQANESTNTGGKDVAQRRGSLLDITV